MKNSTPSLWTEKEQIEIFGVNDPDLSLRTNVLLSYWNGFKHRAQINNIEEAREYLRKKGLKEHRAQVRGHIIGFAEDKMYAEYMLKRKNV